MNEKIEKISQIANVHSVIKFENGRIVRAEVKMSIDSHAAGDGNKVRDSYSANLLPSTAYELNRLLGAIHDLVNEHVLAFPDDIRPA